MVAEFEFDRTAADFSVFFSIFDQQIEKLLASFAHIRMVVFGVGEALMRGSTFVLTSIYTGTKITGVRVFEVRPRDPEWRLIARLSPNEVVDLVLWPLGLKTDADELCSQLGLAEGKLVFKPATE